MSDDSITFPVLTPGELQTLRKYGEEATFQPGDTLWLAGDIDSCFFVVLEGGIIIRNSVGDASPFARHGQGNFSGGIDILGGRPAPVGGYADGVTRVLQISGTTMREIVRVEQDLGGKILAALISRSEQLLDSGKSGMLIIGSPFDPQTTAMRTFLGRNRVIHRWKQSEDESTSEMLSALGLKAADTPIVLLGDQRLIRPTLSDLAERLKLRLDTDKKHFDLIIVGAGPAGLAAAVYGASEGLTTLVLDKSGPGGQASWSSRIENYMGFPEGLSGSILASRGLDQAQKFGATFSVPSDVQKIDCAENGHQVHLTSGETIDCRAVILATGANYQRLKVPGFEKFEGAGIYYAATRIESDYCSESEIVVVGAGNSAGQAAVFLAQTAKKVRLLVRGDRLDKSMSDYLCYRIGQIENIAVHLDTEVAEVHGDEKIESLTLKGALSESVPCDGLFVFIGASPNTEFVRDTVALDKNGFVLTGDMMRSHWEIGRIPFYLETSCPGMFAAGDCRVGSVKRVASSVGEGSMAVTFVHRYLSL